MRISTYKFWGHPNIWAIASVINIRKIMPSTCSINKESVDSSIYTKDNAQLNQKNKAIIN